jgi:predicted Ser/Thr protein kinase
MTSAKYCSSCGSPLTAPDAACPRCLLELGERPSQPSPVPRAWATPAPSVAEIQPDFPGLQVLELVGRGGMGFVYKARQRDLDRCVALKILPPECSSDPAFAERFEREARVLAHLDHPNIVRVHDAGQSGGRYWLTMEFVDGANLRHLIQNGEVGPKEALAIVMQVCAALQYAHDQGVVHRDIKPENILLDLSGKVKIADFGLAKLLAQDLRSVTLTRSDQALGTPQYMAPEQVRRPLMVDHRADIYSLGVVFYELLTGELPMGNFPLPSDKLGVDARLDEVVLRSLEREPERRYQSAREVGTDVDQVSRAAAAGAVAEDLPRGGPALAAATAARAAHAHQGARLERKVQRAEARAERHQRRGPSRTLGLVLGCGGCLLLLILLFVLPVSLLGVREVQVRKAEVAHDQARQAQHEALSRAFESETDPRPLAPPAPPGAAGTPELASAAVSARLLSRIFALQGELGGLRPEHPRFSKLAAELAELERTSAELEEFRRRYLLLEAQHRTLVPGGEGGSLRVELRPFVEERALLEGELEAWLELEVGRAHLSSAEAEQIPQALLPFGKTYHVIVIEHLGSTWRVDDSYEQPGGGGAVTASQGQTSLPERYRRFAEEASADGER